VAETFELDIVYGETVLQVTQDAERVDGPVFSVEARSVRGVRRARHARAVVFAIGYYDHPNVIDVPGEDLPHVSHYYEEAHPYYLQRVVIVGGGNSAAETALELYRAGAHVTLVHRHPELKSTIKYWVRPDIENRIKEGSVAARFSTRVVEIRPTEVVVEGPGGREELTADSVLLLTGYHADSDLLVRAGIRCDATSKPEYDAVTFETNVPGLFLAGGVVSGRDTSPIFIENGRFHGEAIVEVISERLALIGR
jgi:bacillithiol disulfide reductase